MPKVRARSSGGPSVPYARGFKVPTAKQKLKAACSCTDASEEVSKLYTDSPDTPLFAPIPKPSSIDDWLAQYNEEGQSFAKFVKDCPWLSTRKVKYCSMTFRPAGRTLLEKYPDGKIYLLPLEVSDSAEPAVSRATPLNASSSGGPCPSRGGGVTTDTPNFSYLADYAGKFFGIEVKVLPAVQLCVNRNQEEVCWLDNPEVRDFTPTAAQRRRSRRSNRTYRHLLGARFHRKSGNFQLEARSVLLRIRQTLPQDAVCLMALTMCDIYDTPPDLFVAGLAAGNHRVGVFSLRRYDPALSFSMEHWHQIGTTTARPPRGPRRMPSQEKERTLLQRTCKLLVHEISHLLGVDHCIWYSCCMNGSGHLTEDFNQAMHLCPVDLRKLQWLCGFDVVERYSQLLEFYKTHGLLEEERWVTKRLSFIGER